MAYQVAVQNDEIFVLSQEQTTNLLDTWGINNALSEKWDGVYKLVQHNALGAVKLLLATGALQASEQKLDFIIDVQDLEGSQAEAWSEYKEYVLTWLRSINDSAALEDARRELRDEIIDDFVKKAPSYPEEVGEKSPVFSHNISKYGEVDNNNNLYMFAIWGIINMQDTKMTSTQYRSCVWGCPKVNMRLVKFDKHMMNKWNSLCSTAEGLEFAQEKADAATQKAIGDLAAFAKKFKALEI